MFLKQIRKEKNMSQADLSKKIGVSRSTISMWEIGASQPSNELLLRLSQILNVSLDELLGNEVESLTNSQGAEKPESPMLLFTEQELQLIQKYRDNPQMQPAVDTLLGITADSPGNASELPVAARSGKIGKVTPTASVEEQDAALEREFPGIFDETE